MKTAHVHLLSVLAAELSVRGLSKDAGPIRLLDVGCGYGRLMRDLLRSLPRLGIGLPAIEIYGYEVFDHRGSTPGYHDQVCRALSRLEPAVDWKDRVRLGNATEPWPFPDGFFDGAFSNQVLEHVEDLESFFQQLQRVVKPAGFAAHFYPSKAVIVEPHSGVPGAHWVGRHALLAWLRFWSRLGWGKFPSYRKNRGLCLGGFCEEFCEYLGRYVYLRPNAVVLGHAERWSQVAGFKYTSGLLRRAMTDDWEPFPYRYAPAFRDAAGLSAFACSTLLQRL